MNEIEVKDEPDAESEDVYEDEEDSVGEPAMVQKD